MTSHDYSVPAVDLAGGGRMPLLGFGTWEISDADATGAVSVALEAGYRHIDPPPATATRPAWGARSPLPVWTGTRSS